MSDNNEMKIREVGEAIPKPSEQARRIALALLYFQYKVQFESSVSAEEKEQIVQDAKRIEVVFAHHAARSRSYAWYRAVADLVDEVCSSSPWISTKDKLPDECETVLLMVSGRVAWAYWQEEQEGDWENGYKRYKQWYYIDQDSDQFEPVDKWPEWWMPLAKPPEVKP